MVGGYAECFDMAARLSQDDFLYWCEGFIIRAKIVGILDDILDGTLDGILEEGIVHDGDPSTLDACHHLLACMALRASFVLGNRLEHLEGRTELKSLFALLSRG